jgi:hypothetical protein
MANEQFLKGFAISNLAGSGFGNLMRLFLLHKVEPKYYWRAFLNSLLSLILSILALGDKLVYFLVRNKLKKIPPPLFIIGHWRSGTTHLHNLFCLDERAGYSTTFQTVFPHLLFGFHRPLLWLMNMVMPEKRPVDNVLLNARNPQEEEFGLANITEMSYYHWWYFPADWDSITEKYLTLENLPEKQKERWKKIYRHYIKRALIREGKAWFVSKNPPNTARIKLLLELFPDARFVYIQRNPYEVYVSTQRFFSAILQPLQLQSISEKDLNAHILDVYCKMYDAYQAQKVLIPKNRLVEISYEQFIQNEASYLRFIYNQLEIKLPEALPEKWELATGNKKHRVSGYAFPSETIAEVNSALGSRVAEMGYERLNAD